MKIYQFYSDYNDSWNSDIHSDIRWKVSTSNVPMPEKYMKLGEQYNVKYHVRPNY